MEYFLAVRKLYLRLILISIIFGQALPVQHVSDGMKGHVMNSSFAKLPGDLRPLKYNIWIRPVLEDSKDFTASTAPGKVFITFVVVKETKQIVLHAKQLQISESEVKVCLLT